MNLYIYFITVLQCTIALPDEKVNWVGQHSLPFSTPHVSCFALCIKTITPQFTVRLWLEKQWLPGVDTM